MLHQALVPTFIIRCYIVIFHKFSKGFCRRHSRLCLQWAYAAIYHIMALGLIKTHSRFMDRLNYAAFFSYQASGAYSHGSFVSIMKRIRHSNGFFHLRPINTAYPHKLVSHLFSLQLKLAVICHFLINAAAALTVISAKSLLSGRRFLQNLHHTSKSIIFLYFRNFCLYHIAYYCTGDKYSKSVGFSYSSSFHRHIFYGQSDYLAFFHCLAFFHHPAPLFNALC